MIKAILKIKITHRFQIIRMINNKDRKSRVSKKIKNNTKKIFMQEKARKKISFMSRTKNSKLSINN